MELETFSEDEEIAQNNRINHSTRMSPEVTIMLPHENSNTQLSLPGSRRMTGDNLQLQEMGSMSRRQSVVATIRRQSVNLAAQRRLIMEMLHGRRDSQTSVRKDENGQRPARDKDYDSMMHNRNVGDDALTTVLSAFYAKLLVVLGIAFPVTDILSFKAHPSFYQGFYLYLYVGSVAFVAYMYSAHLRTRAIFTMIDSFQDKKNPIIKSSITRYGSFYLRVGAIAFGIGSMVYSGLEFGQYFELKGEPGCQNVLIALTPAARTILCIVQMQFIFLNTKEFEMGRHKVIARFGLMHMVATNLCEWLYVLVAETKHEIIHLQHNYPEFKLNSSEMNGSENITSADSHEIFRRATTTEIVVECRRTNIMGSLVQNASPFLFPCTIEYSLICAVILFEMWKQILSSNNPKKLTRKISTQGAHQFSLDCSRAHRGMFAGILVIVLCIISLIMFYVLSDIKAYQSMATLEVSISEIILYILTVGSVMLAYKQMRDLKFNKTGGISLDCTLLLLAQVGVYIYSMFSVIGCYFAMKYEPDEYGSAEGLVAEIFGLLQTSVQTIFILNAWFRRCKSAQQGRSKPGRESITFLLVSNMAMWFLNTLVKNRAMFRPTHLRFFGVWAWTIITHVSMPLAIFYRFHSTICLFEIWKMAYKMKKENSVTYQ